MVEKRGRKALEDLCIVPIMPGEDKPGPPEDMPEQEANIWRSVVDAMPLRWFGRETWGLLRLYCFHEALARQLIEKLRDTPILSGRESARGRPRKYERPRKLSWSALAAALDRETKAVAVLASKLRLSKQAVHVTKAEADVRNQPRKRLWA